LERRERYRFFPELKRRCLLTGCFQRNQFIPEFRGFYKNMGILLGGVSDCEELFEEVIA
jgi:hypothetical protein